MSLGFLAPPLIPHPESVIPSPFLPCCAGNQAQGLEQANHAFCH